MVPPPLFRCTGTEDFGSDLAGTLCYIELIEVSGQRMRLACPPEGVVELVNRFQMSAEMALARRGATQHVAGEQQAIPAPKLTSYRTESSDDANSIVLELTTGTAKLAVAIERKESPKLRAALYAAEKAVDLKKRKITN